VKQEHRHSIKNVYAPYDDIVCFVERSIEDGELILHTNTLRKSRLDPEYFFINYDGLYILISKAFSSNKNILLPFTTRGPFQIVISLETSSDDDLSKWFYSYRLRASHSRASKE